MEQRRRAFPPASPLRQRRLGFGVTLAESARAAGVTLTAASHAERAPEKADPEVLRRLAAAVERLAAKEAIAAAR